jgi:hypothetical protein
MTDIAPWMQTVSGLAVDLLEPQPQQIRLHDIAWSLARLPRFGGHTRGVLPWTVGEHSLLVESLMPADSPPVLRLAALLHDAHEAYMGADIISPVKAAFRVLFRALAHSGSEDPLFTVAHRLDIAIHGAFAIFPLSDTDRAAIHHADRQAMGIEGAQLMGEHPRPWIELPDAPDIKLEPRWPAETHARFVSQTMELMAFRHGLPELNAASMMKARADVL